MQEPHCPPDDDEWWKVRSWMTLAETEAAVAATAMKEAAMVVRMVR